MKNKRRYQSALFEFFALSQQNRMGKADYESAYAWLDERDKLVIDALCLELENRVNRSGFGRMCQLELLAKLGLWMKDHGVQPQQFSKTLTLCSPPNDDLC